MWPFRKVIKRPIKGIRPEVTELFNKYGVTHDVEVDSEPGNEIERLANIQKNMSQHRTNMRERGITSKL